VPRAALSSLPDPPQVFPPSPTPTAALPRRPWTVRLAVPQRLRRMRVLPLAVFPLQSHPAGSGPVRPFPTVPPTHPSSRHTCQARSGFRCLGCAQSPLAPSLAACQCRQCRSSCLHPSQHPPSQAHPRRPSPLPWITSREPAAFCLAQIQTYPAQRAREWMSGWVSGWWWWVSGWWWWVSGCGGG